MRTQRSATSSTAGLISILVIYLLLIILILVFARQIIRDVSLESPVSNYVVIPIALALPLFLFAVIVLNVVRIFRDQKRAIPGVRLKIRLMMFFTFVTILCSIPQGVLSISFIEIAMNRWFSSPVAEGVKGGVDLVLQYNLEKVETLRTFGRSPVVANVLKDIDRAPQKVWDQINSTSNLIHTMQIITSEGTNLGSYGDKRGALPVQDYRQLVSRRDGLLPKESFGGYSALRYLTRQRIGDRTYSVIFSTIIPKDFDIKAAKLTASSDTFKQIEQFQPAFRITLIIFYSFFSIPLLLLSILVSFLLSDEVVQPIVSLEEATRRVAEGDFSFRILNRGGNELETLVRSFNRMVSELERSRMKLLQTEKISAWQEIARRMAHEIKNPLTPIKLSAQRILYRYREGADNLEKILEPAMKSIIDEVENLNNLLQEFRDFARLPAPQFEPVGLKKMLAEVVEMYSSSYPHIVVDLQELNDNTEILVDKNQMKQVFSNLLKNAFEAISGIGKVALHTDLVRKGDNQYCRIQVSDTGSGIDSEFHNQVFNPYFTTKSKGTGLGLPIVERIIFDHNGQIWFETEKGVGTTFFVDLPLRK